MFTASLVPLLTPTHRLAPLRGTSQRSQSSPLGAVGLQSVDEANLGAKGFRSSVLRAVFTVSQLEISVFERRAQANTHLTYTERRRWQIQ